MGEAAEEWGYRLKTWPKENPHGRLNERAPCQPSYPTLFMKDLGWYSVGFHD